MRGVRDAQQQVSNLGAHRSGLGRQRLLLLAQLAALRLGGRRIVGASVLVELAHLLRQHLDLRPQVVSLPAQPPLVLVELGDPVDVGGVDAPTGDAALTTSGSVRMRRMSSMVLDGTRRPPSRTTAMFRSASSVGMMPALEVRDLFISYGSTRAVNGLTFSAEPGEVLAVLGPNGAGKTSTIECLEGYRRPSGGQVRVLGLDPIAQHDELVPQIGVMLQSGGVYPGIRPLEALQLHAAFYAVPPTPTSCWNGSG